MSGQVERIERLRELKEGVEIPRLNVSNHPHALWPLLKGVSVKSTL